jgi:peptidyl-prolyl cis-trans isomerase B (cyclophilin B)
MKIKGAWALPFVAMLALAGCAPSEPAAGGSTPGETKPEGEKPAETTSIPASQLPTTPADGEEVAVLETEKGRIVVMFYPQKAPKHVENFKSLVKEGFYDGTRFHRCIEGFMIQGGDPNSKDKGLAGVWGRGGKVVDGKERNVELEASDLRHTRGILSMARGQDVNSASSQFFLMHQDSPSLDGQYSAFGRIVEGIEVVDKIVPTGNAADNGSVKPEDAVVLKKATLQTWPLKAAKPAN